MLATLVAAALRFWQLGSIPPGLHYDLASNALITQDIVNGWRPIFITAFTGKEVLFFYSSALFFGLLGPSVFALRLTAALWGTLAIPATYFTAHELSIAGDSSRPTARAVAITAALIAATLFMHVVWSRFGFRVITEPVIQALALGFLFRGLRRQSWRDLILAGSFTGLAAYTYLAARLFPIPLAAALGVLLLAHWVQPKYRRATVPTLARLLAYGGAALLVFAPLGLFFLQNPETFFTRISQVAPRADQSNQIATAILGSFGMLFVSGEPYDRFNIPYRPIFDALQAALFLLGVGVTLWRLPRPKAPLGWAAEALLLIWVPVMLLPTALAINEIFPSNVRAFGLLPVLLIFPARGLVALVAWLTLHWSTLRRRLLPTAFALTLTAGLTLTSYDYFIRWASQPTLPAANDTDLSNAANYLNAHPPGPDTAIFMSAIHYRHPTLAFLSPHYDRIRWLTGGYALAIPPGGPAAYFFPQSAPLPAEWLAGWEHAQTVATTEFTPGAGFDAYAFADATAIPQPTFQPTDLNFSYIAQVTGYHTALSADATTLNVDIRLRVLNPPPAGDFQPYLRLMDADGFAWAQTEIFAYPSEQWQIGDTVFIRLPLALPIGLPPKRYTLRLGLFSPGTDANLAVIAANGEYAGERGTLGDLTLTTPPTSPTTATDWLAAHVPIPPTPAYTTPGLTLLGASFPTRNLPPGDWLTVELIWQVDDISTVSDLTLTLADQTWPLASALAVARPTPLLRDRFRLRLPADLPPGDHPLTLTLDGQTVTLTTITIQPVERSFTPPAEFTPTSNLTFGADIALLGYQLTPGLETTVTLVWQATAQPADDYTVFVHILDPTGALIAQRDTAPVNGLAPTRLWATNQIITDAHTFGLPPGSYQLAVGLYRPETGQRLPLPNGDTRALLTPFTVPGN